ncbi:hypothetical protein NZF17_000652 [Salmonella enterica]|nr:hypothetical protein [Salmonella enterica]
MSRGNQFQDEDSGVLLYHNPETRETEILIDEHRRGQSAVQTAMMRLLNENARASTRFVSRPVLQNCRQTQDRQATSGEPGMALKDLVGLSGVRYSHKPTADGLHLSLAQSGLLPEQVVLVKRILRQPEGMAILSGPTGSGKFATLKRLLTVEKPPEGRIPGSIRTPVICDRADEAEVRRTRERTIFPSRGAGDGRGPPAGAGNQRKGQRVVCRAADAGRLPAGGDRWQQGDHREGHADGQPGLTERRHVQRRLRTVVLIQGVNTL